MTYRISGLDAGLFQPLFELDDEALGARGARRYIADSKPGFPCRVTLEDADVGERVVLLNYVHQPAATPYASSHAIYVREGAARAAEYVDRIPASLRERTLSVRAFDASGMMTDAALTEGSALEPVVLRMLASDEAAYLHVHYATRGCFAARVDRAT